MHAWVARTFDPIAHLKDGMELQFQSLHIAMGGSLSTFTSQGLLIIFAVLHSGTKLEPQLFQFPWKDPYSYWKPLRLASLIAEEELHCGEYAKNLCIAIMMSANMYRSASQLVRAKSLQRCFL